MDANLTECFKSLNAKAQAYLKIAYKGELDWEPNEDDIQKILNIETLDLSDIHSKLEKLKLNLVEFDFNLGLFWNLSEFKDFKNLKTLNLCGMEVKSAKSISELKYLENLTISRNTFKLMDLPLLPIINSLNIISDICDDNSSQLIYFPFSQFPNLEYLSINGIVIDKMEDLDELLSLKEISFINSECENKPLIFPDISNLENLETVIIRNSDFVNIEALNLCKHLKSLEIQQLPDDFEFDSFPKLEILQINNLPSILEIKRINNKFESYLSLGNCVMEGLIKQFYPLEAVEKGCLKQDLQDLLDSQD